MGMREHEGGRVWSLGWLRRYVLMGTKPVRDARRSGLEQTTG